MKFITSIALLLLASVGMAQNVPNTFSSGTPALASEVNENFADVDGRVTMNSDDGAALTTVVDGLFAEITIEETVIAEEEFLAIAQCPVDTVAVSANCSCGGDGLTENFGVLSLCAAGDDGVGQSAGAFCDIDFSFDPALAMPRALVSAVCVGATQVDGTKVTSSILTKPSASRKLSGMPSDVQIQFENAQKRADYRKLSVAQ